VVTVPEDDGGHTVVTLHVEAAPFPQEITKPCCGQDAARLILDERTSATSCSNCGTRIEFIHDRRSENESDDNTEQAKLVTDGGTVEQMRAAATTGYRPGCAGHAETDAPIVIGPDGLASCPMCAEFFDGGVQR
jgi:hypothetical protein